MEREGSRGEGTETGHRFQTPRVVGLLEPLGGDFWREPGQASIGGPGLAGGRMQGIQTHFRAAWGLQAGVEVDKELAEEDRATSAMGRSQPWSRERQSQRAQGGLMP